MVIFRNGVSQSVILGTNGEDVLKMALQCFLDHRAIGDERTEACRLIDYIEGRFPKDEDQG